MPGGRLLGSLVVLTEFESGCSIDCLEMKSGLGNAIPGPHNASVLLLLLAARRVLRLARRMALAFLRTGITHTAPVVAWPERRIGVGRSSRPETEHRRRDNQDESPFHAGRTLRRPAFSSQYRYHLAPQDGSVKHLANFYGSAPNRDERLSDLCVHGRARVTDALPDPFVGR